MDRHSTGIEPRQSRLSNSNPGKSVSLGLVAIGCAYLATLLPGFWPGTSNAASNGATYFATVSVSERQLRYEMTLPGPSDAILPGKRANEPYVGNRNTETVDAIGSGLRILADGEACSSAHNANTTPASDGSGIRIALIYECPGAPRILSVRYALFEVLGDGHRTIALIVWPGGTQQFTFQKDQSELQLDLITGQVATTAPEVLFVGLKQTLLGWNLLLFLACLLLPVRGATHLLQVLAGFAAAQSLGLLTAGIGWIALPDRVTGAAIALSLAYVAGENLFGTERIARKRWLVACVSGLVFGIWLSAALTPTGLSQDSGTRALFAYEIGVATGLIVFLSLALPLLFWMRRNRWAAQGATTISVLAIALGLSSFAGHLFG